MKCCYPGCDGAVVYTTEDYKSICAEHLTEHLTKYLAERRPPEDPAAKAEREDLLAKERAYEDLKSRIMLGRASADEVDRMRISERNWENWTN
jgi:hypothetical protein